MELTPNQPYLIRAIYEWLVDNNQTPCLLLDANRDGVQHLAKYAVEGQITLNIAPKAVSNLEITNERVSCNAMFSGISVYVSLPVTAILAICSKENLDGIMFTNEGAVFTRAEPNPDPDSSPPAPDKPPGLRLVK